MFKLKLPTDPRWANIAEANLEEILTDHAWCEQNCTRRNGTFSAGSRNH